MSPCIRPALRPDHGASPRNRGPRVVALVALLSLVLAACGGSGAGTGDAAGEGDSQTYELKVTADQTADAAAAGKEAGRGKKYAKPTGKKIALIEFSSAVTSSERTKRALEEVADEFGFEFVSCDPNFDAQKVKQCASAMLAEKPDVIFSYIQEAAALGSAVQDAAAQGIPWISLGSQITPHPDIVQYMVEAEHAQRAIDAWILENFGDEGDPGKVMGMTATAAGDANVAYAETLEEELGDNPLVDLEVVHDLDLANIQQDTTTAVRTALTRHPDLDVIWTVCDTCVPTVYQAVQSSGGSAAVAGSFSAPQTIDLIRAGHVDAIVDSPWEVFSWIAMDKMVESWATDEELPADYSGYPIELGEPYVITQENVGEGTSPILGPDFESFFRAKWSAEFAR